MNKISFMINSLTMGGAEKVVVTLLRELNRQLIPVQLICMERNVFFEVDQEINIHYLSSFRGDESPVIKLLLIPYFALKLRQYVKKNKITCIQSHLYRANYVNVLSKILGSRHIVQIVNCAKISQYKEGGVLGKVNLTLIRMLYARADLVILKSRNMRTDMNTLFKIQAPQIVIHNPCEINQIQVKAEETDIPFIFNKSKRYICTVGRLISSKRIVDLLEAVSLLEFSNLEILVIGDGEEKKALEQYALMKGIHQNTHFLGMIHNPYKYMKRCDLLISCSESEGFPNVLVEALVCETPVISADCISGPREILAPESDCVFQLKNEFELAEFGVLVPVRRPDLVSRAIKKLLNDDVLLGKYRVAGIRRAKDFDISSIVKQYKVVLN